MPASRRSRDPRTPSNAWFRDCGASGISCATPAGAFYCFPDVSGLLERTGLTSESFAERLLDDAHVAVLAGSAFGPGGKGHLRMCYATDPTLIDLALERIRMWVGSRTGVAVPR